MPSLVARFWVSASFSPAMSKNIGLQTWLATYASIAETGRQLMNSLTRSIGHPPAEAQARHIPAATSSTEPFSVSTRTSSEPRLYRSLAVTAPFLLGRFASGREILISCRVFLLIA